MLSVLWPTDFIFDPVIFLGVFFETGEICVIFVELDSINFYEFEWSRYKVV